MNFVREQVIITEVQTNLVELEGLIAHQMEESWTEPNLVTTELGDILNGIWLGRTTGNQLGTLSSHDEKILEDLYAHLSHYPTDDLYGFAELSEEDQEKFENLRGTLREVGLGLNITISNDMNSFMNKAKALNERMGSSLK
ncbi:hypothetical protein V1502_10515 [Bacillus sp. SCS-153A]|uniref:hypothetical protein n=1 Tax=Rossellomorea sedimentorum TaxID=3115294 RepID=UPI003906B238